MNKVHERKSRSDSFSAMISGDKPFDIRKDEDFMRSPCGGFRKGDGLYLREWDMKKNQYTLRAALFLITYVRRYDPSPVNKDAESHGLSIDFVCLGVRKVHEGVL